MNRLWSALAFLLVLIPAFSACGGQTEVTVVATPTPGPTPTPAVQEVEVTVVATPTPGPTPTPVVQEVSVVATPTPGPTPTPVVQEVTVVATPTPQPAPTAAPVPSAAYGPQVPQDKGYVVEELGDGLYWVTDGVYQTMFLTTGQGVIAVDAPPNLGENYLSAIAEVTDEPVTHVIYSHHHADHIGAAAMFPDDATYIAQEQVAEKLAAASAGDPAREPFPFGLFIGGSPVPLPTETFTDSRTLTVGSQTLELEYRGPNHSLGNIFIYAPEQRVLMVVDVIFPGWVPFKNLVEAVDTQGFVEVHDEVLSYDFDTLVAGHVGRLGTREDVETQREYVMDIRANAAQALQTVDFFAVAQETGFENIWLLIDTYLDDLAQECANLTAPEWTGRLAGADIWTLDHCDKMVQSLRLD